jgi:hypothetical protein
LSECHFPLFIKHASHLPLTTQAAHISACPLPFCFLLLRPYRAPRTALSNQLPEAMGHGISCARSSDELEFFRALQSGDLDAVREALSLDRDLVHRCTPYGRVSPLHIAAANGHLEVSVEIPFFALHVF